MSIFVAILNFRLMEISFISI